MNKEYTIKQAAIAIKEPVDETRKLVRSQLKDNEHAAFKNEKGHWRITGAGIIILQAYLEPDPSHPPVSPAIPIGMIQVPVVKLPMNQRLVMVEVEGNTVRATCRPSIRNKLRPKNLVFVEHMEGDMYHVVRV